MVKKQLSQKTILTKSFAKLNLNMVSKQAKENSPFKF